MIAVVVTILITGSVPNQEIVAVLPILCASIALQFLPVFLDRDADLFSPTSWTGLKDGFDVTVAVVALILAGRIELGPLSVLPEAQRILLVQQIGYMQLLARIAYLLGYYWRGAARPNPRPSQLGNRRWNSARLTVVCVLLFGVFVLFYMQFQSRLGGAMFDLARLREAKAIWRGDASMSWMTRGVQLGFLPVVLIFMYASRRHSRLGLCLALVVYAFVALLVTRIGQRAPAVMVGGMLLMLYHYGWRKVPLPVFLVALLLAVLSVNVLGNVRSGAHDEMNIDEAFAAQAGRPMNAVAEHATDRDRITAQATILHFFPDKRDFLWGKSWAPITTLLIPRWLYPDKYGGEIWTDSRIIYQLAGVPVPASLPSMLYANFSWIGVFVGMYFWGRFHYRLYRWRKSSNDMFTTLMYVLLLTSFSPLFLGISQAIQYVLPLYVLIFLVTDSKLAVMRARPAGLQLAAPTTLGVHAGATRTQQ